MGLYDSLMPGVRTAASSPRRTVAAAPAPWAGGACCAVSVDSAAEAEEETRSAALAADARIIEGARRRQGLVPCRMMAASLTLQAQLRSDPGPVLGRTADSKLTVADAGSRGDGAASHPVDVPDEVLEEEEDLIASKELAAELMDGSTFGKRGEQWLLAQVAAVAMLLFPPLVLKGLVDFLATVSLTAGLVFMVSALFSLGRSISPLPQPRKKHQLVVSGIYGYARHPMYGGLLLAALGLAVLTRNETRLAITAVLWWVLENMVRRAGEGGG
ncbi:hypothetical protein TSOC_014007 [Tetrabaena socialis]|uniref:Protein-S-isoprenylcysteine O-methyltransferase n=1 Tax=Tetrabaena socialis TaxID=47790 RepID=A0A2J7ZIT5_9CHLO|nr:hypothetical protein TSOC_014007 [Tetrabaena socialis]|eukprot:PNH00185.1 hypothetical protein TSOC_014007 [Tetrabaena socialis]